jgi:hypothetical protein
MEWKRIPVWTGCGMAFFFAGVSARHTSLQRLEPRWTVFNSRSRAQKKMVRAAGVHLMWSGEWGWEVSLAIEAPGRPSRAVTTHRAVRVHRPDAFGTALLARYGRAKDVGINQ